MTDEQRTYNVGILTIADFKILARRNAAVARNDLAEITQTLPLCIGILEKVAPWVEGEPLTSYGFHLNAMMEAVADAANPKSAPEANASAT